MGKLLKLLNANTVSATASTSGTGWSDISSPEFVGSISDIEFGSSDHEILVTMSNFGVQSIWYTNDGGASWSAKEGNLPDMPVKTILRNPLRPEQVLIGTEMGTWATYNFFDSYPSWYYVGGGMNTVKVTDLELRDDNKVYASTYGRGIFSGQFTAANGIVGIDENELNAISSLYPNPAKDFSVLQTNIEFTNPTIRIYSTTGQLVKEYQYKTTHTKFKFSTEGIKSGIYTVQINSNEKSYSKKLIVQ